VKSKRRRESETTEGRETNTKEDQFEEAKPKGRVCTQKERDTRAQFTELFAGFVIGIS